MSKEKIHHIVSYFWFKHNHSHLCFGTSSEDELLFLGEHEREDVNALYSEQIAIWVDKDDMCECTPVMSSFDTNAKLIPIPGWFESAFFTSLLP